MRRAGALMDLQELTERVEALEERLGGKVAEMEAIVLRDDQGRARIRMVAGPQQPSITFYDEHGHERIGIALAHNGPWVFLRDANGQQRVTVTAMEEAQGITIYDAPGKARLSAGLKGSEPAFALHDTDQGPRVVLHLSGEGIGTLGFFDADGGSWGIPPREFMEAQERRKE
jgi:hypothetical protein